MPTFSKNLEPFLNLGDTWKKGAEIFDLNQTTLANGTLGNTVPDAFTLTKVNSLKVLTVKTGKLEIQGTNKNGHFFYKRTYKDNLIFP